VIGNKVYQGSNVCENGICRPMTQQEAYDLAICKQNFDHKMKNMSKKMTNWGKNFSKKMNDWSKDFSRKMKS
jgi:hypothetical protein